MRETLRAYWDEIRTGSDEPIERGPGVIIAAASAYPIVWLVIAGGAALGWW